ncbi:MAG TPA: methionine--tRNA ligase [Terriglobales bacterium]|nr:methionine--tRNA ligase [Terriglobales bacterium]
MSTPVYVTTSLPYVNAAPHLGIALEFVLADTLARFHRLTGAPTRLQSGTDDNSLKNVLAAEREGIPTRTLVERNARAFERLLHRLDVQADGFIRTSCDPIHAEGVAALWRACEVRGDLYRRRYRGLYCVGCEQFYTPDELENGRCPEHGTPPETVEEENWFFRLSRYQGEVLRLLESGRLRVVPETRRREALAFVAGGLRDLSVSRAHERARGWGIPVPGDPEQVVYVWFDALANYITALGYPRRTAAYRTFWEQATTTHVIGKGILRFHAVYWPAILLSAGLPPPDRLLVHGYLQANGARLSKSSGNTADPGEAADHVGTEALRYWLLRALGRGEDADWTEARALDLRRAELSNELGNLLQRTVSLVRRGGGVVRPARADASLGATAAGLADRITSALDAELDPQAALTATWELVRGANRYANERQPWRLAGAERDGAVLSLAEALRVVSEALRPFLPRTADAIASQLGVPHAPGDWRAALEWDGRVAGATPGEPWQLFPRA